jgi:uncharacterized protein
MSLKDKLLEDMKMSMKEKNIIKKNTIQMIRSAVLQVEKDKKITLDDDGIIEILAQEQKQRKDSLSDYEKSGRQDLIDTLNEEIAIILQYLPKQLSEDELFEIIVQAAKEIGATSPSDMGNLMKAVMPKVKGKADGKSVSMIVKKVLG